MKPDHSDIPTGITRRDWMKTAATGAAAALVPASAISGLGSGVASAPAAGASPAELVARRPETEILDIKNYGGLADGTTDDRRAVASADASAAGANTVAFTTGTWYIGSNITVSSPAWVVPGSVIKPARGVTVTFRSAFWAADVQCFDLSLGGSIAFSKAPHGYAEWWGCVGDGATDDTTPFNHALTALGAAGTWVNLVAGKTYLLTSCIAPSNGGIHGRATIKRRDAMGGTGDMDLVRSATSASYVSFAGFTVDGNASNQVAATGLNANQVGIRLTSGSIKCTVRGVEVHDCLNTGIYVSSTTDCEIDGCYVHDQLGDTPTGAPGDAIAVRNSTRASVRRNHCVDNSHGAGVQFTQSTGTVSGNECTRNNDGIQLYCSDSSHPVYETTVVGNVCVGNNSGITTALGPGAVFGNIYGVTISANSCTANTSCGMSLTNLSDSAIVGNALTRNGIDGIIANRVSHCSFSGNTFNGNNTGNTAAHGGLFVKGTSQYNAVSGNTFVNGSGHQYHCINLSVSTVTDTAISGNSTTSGYVTSAVNDAGARTSGLVHSTEAGMLDLVNVSRGSIGVTQNGTQVIGRRRTGWTNQTATASRADLGSSPTVGQLAAFCSALYADLKAHGLIGN